MSMLPAKFLLGAPVFTGVSLALSGYYQSVEEDKDADNAEDATKSSPEFGVSLENTTLATVGSLLAFTGTTQSATEFGIFTRQLEFGLRWSAVTLLPLSYRFCTAMWLSGKKKKNRKRRAMLQDLVVSTGAQTALAVPTQIVAAVTFGTDYLHVVPVIASTFLVGQVLQSSNSPTHRSLGLAFSTLPSVFVLLAGMAYFLVDA